MKKCFTSQKSANRHPKKYNFNRIETLPVVERRRLGYGMKPQIKRDENGEIIYVVDKNGNKTNVPEIEVVRTNESIQHDIALKERAERKAAREAAKNNEKNV